MFFGFGWWLSCVAIDDGSVGLALVFEFHDGFDTCSDRSGSTFVCSGLDEVVEVAEEGFGKPNGDLFCGHWGSIPNWDAIRYATALGKRGTCMPERSTVFQPTWSKCRCVQTTRSTLS